MKKSTYVAAAALFVGAAIGCRTQQEKLKLTKTMTAEAFASVMPKMMSTLQKTIQTKGYAEAVKVCNIEAPQIAKNARRSLQENFMKKYGATILGMGRSSMKLRNPKNAPEKPIRRILESWEANAKKPTLVSFEKDGYYYGIAPIRIVSPTCLNCHGQKEELQPEAMQQIQKLYPQDKATEYRLDDLRGAFYLKLKL